MNFYRVINDIHRRPRGNIQPLLDALRVCVVKKALASSPGDPVVEEMRQRYNFIGAMLWRQSRVYDRRFLFKRGTPPTGLQKVAAASVRKSLLATMTDRDRYDFQYGGGIHPMVKALDLPMELQEFVQFA